MAAMATKSSQLQIMKDTELIKLPGDKYKYINTSYQKVSAKMYDSKCDIKLRVDTDTFRAHRDILAEASDYFAAMFSHNMREKEQGDIELHGISPGGFTCMLEYLYHGHITVDTNNIEDVLEAARFFHIEWLVSICCDFLIRHKSLENYKSVLEVADKYYLGDLRMDIIKFIGQNFGKLAKEPKMMMLTFDLFQQILEEEYYIEADETVICRTALQWLDYDPDERAQYRLPLMRLIRFPLVDKALLEMIPDSVRSIPELGEMISEAIIYITNPTQQCLMQSVKTERRGSIKVISLFSAIEDASLIQYKIPGEPDFLSEQADTSFMQSMFEFASVAVLGNFLFVAGGYDRKKYVSSSCFYHYNPRNRMWAQLSAMNQARVSFPLCAADNGLYAINGIEHTTDGGFDAETILSSVEFYDPVQNRWSFTEELPYGCFSSAAVFCEGKVYLSGGISDDPEDVVPVLKLSSYDPAENSWVNLEPMTTARHSHAMISYGKKLFVFGGYSVGPDTMSFSDSLLSEQYDIETNQWSYVSPLPQEVLHGHPSAGLYNGKVYILGGAGGEVHRYLVTYDLEQDEMSEGEYCGEGVCRLAVLQVPLPPDIEFLDCLDDEVA